MFSVALTTGSHEERKAVQRAFRYSSRRKHQVYDVPEPDVTFTLDAPDDVTVGDDFTITVNMKVGGSHKYKSFTHQAFILLTLYNNCTIIIIKEHVKYTVI